MCSAEEDPAQSCPGDLNVDYYEDAALTDGAAGGACEEACAADADCRGYEYKDGDDSYACEFFVVDTYLDDTPGSRANGNKYRCRIKSV